MKKILLTVGMIVTAPFYYLNRIAKHGADYKILSMASWAVAFFLIVYMFFTQGQYHIPFFKLMIKLSGEMFLLSLIIGVIYKAEILVWCLLLILSKPFAEIHLKTYDEIYKKDRLFGII